MRVPSSPQTASPVGGAPDFGAMDDNAAPMGNDPDMGQGFNPDDDLDMGPANNGNDLFGNDFGGEENPFDSNFDAGVEADEDEDPKKFIQQLTGKLSQSLRSYNESLPTPDVDLSKYVAGMILKQSMQNIPKNEIGEIVKNAEGDDTEEDIALGESVERLDGLIGGNPEDTQTKKPRSKRGDSFRRRPFTSPDFN